MVKPAPGDAGKKEPARNNRAGLPCETSQAL